MFASVLKSVEVLLLNMCNLLELSGLFVCLGVLVKFFSALEGGGGRGVEKITVVC